jgi:hypothetical protein
MSIGGCQLPEAELIPPDKRSYRHVAHHEGFGPVSLLALPDTAAQSPEPPKISVTSPITSVVVLFRYFLPGWKPLESMGIKYVFTYRETYVWFVSWLVTSQPNSKETTITLLDTMKAERTKLVKALEAHKSDPAITARISELKAELAKLTAQLSGADLKAQIAAVDRAIKAVENPNRVSKPMSEAGKAAIKAGLQRYHENRKKAASAPAAPPAVPVAGKKKA